MALFLFQAFDSCQLVHHDDGLNGHADGIARSPIRL